MVHAPTMILETLCDISTACVEMTSSLEHRDQLGPNIGRLVLVVLVLSAATLTIVLYEEFWKK